MTFHRVYKPSPSSRLTQKKASSFAPRTFAVSDAEGLETAQADNFWPQRMERASRLGHNFVNMPSPPSVIQRVKGGKEAAQAPPRQLHIFVNLEGIPANRVAVFLEHFMGRLRKTGGRGTALNITSDYKAEDISKESSLKVKDPEAKSQENEEKKVQDLRDSIDKKQRTYSQRLDPQQEEPGKYDEVVVIGVAQPKGKPGEDGMYSAYENVSGLKDIGKLSKQIQELVDQNLKKDGHLRVQLCHAGSVKVDEGDKTFSESLVPPEKKEITVSAPKNFSVIGDSGGFVDFTTKMGIFDKNKGAARSKLLGKIRPGAPVREELEKRTQSFLGGLNEGVRGQIKDIRFGNMGDDLVEEQEPQRDPVQEIEPGSMGGAPVDKEQQERVRRLSLFGDLKSKTLIKRERYAQEVQRIAKLKPGSAREGRRLAKRSSLFERKHESATKKIAEYEKELAGLE